MSANDTDFLILGLGATGSSALPPTPSFPEILVTLSAAAAHSDNEGEGFFKIERSEEDDVDGLYCVALVEQEIGP